MMTTEAKLPPVSKRVSVRGTPEQAFTLFTAGMARWWPLATHSVGQGETVTCAVDPRVGGRLFETDRAGAESIWGTVLVWEPPARLVFTWHPGRDAETAQTVEVTFTAAGAQTVLRLEHQDWHRTCEGAAQMRDRYDGGWDMVLGHYAAA